MPTPQKKARPKTAAKPAPKPKKKPAKPGTPLTSEALLARSGRVAGGIQHAAQVIGFVRAARVCVAAGRAELAAALAEVMPAHVRGGVLAIAAGGGAGSAEVAIDEILVAAAATPRDRPVWAATAFEASKLLAGTPRCTELVALVDQVVDEALGEEPAWGTYNRFDALVPLFCLQIEHGEARAVRRVLERGLQVDLESTGAVLQINGLLWKIADGPQQLFPLIEAIKPRDRYTPLIADRGLSLCSRWSRADLDALLAFESGIRSRLAKELVEAGRLEDARHVLFSSPSEGWREPALVAEEHLLVGDVTSAKHALAEQSQAPQHVTRLKIQLGIESIDSALRRLRKPAAKSSVMASVQSLIALAHLALDRSELDLLDDIDAAIENQLASTHRTQYDLGVEGSTRSSLADLRARVATTRGGPATVHATIEADIAALPALHAHTKDAWQRGQLTQSLARRALQHGFPELALQASKKLRFTAGDTHFPCAVAAGFLPADPAAALRAFDTLVKEPDQGLLVQGYGQVSLLAQLWSAVVGTPS